MENKTENLLATKILYSSLITIIFAYEMFIASYYYFNKLDSKFYILFSYILFIVFCGYIISGLMRKNKKELIIFYLNNLRIISILPLLISITSILLYINQSLNFWHIITIFVIVLIKIWLITKISDYEDLVKEEISENDLVYIDSKYREY